MIVLTEPAARKVKELMSRENGDAVALRVAVRPGGCSGFTYEMFFDSEINEDDEVAEIHGVKVAVDKVSSKFLDGASLDYREGLMDAGFTLDNPNAQRTCGCGQSFS